MTFRSEGKDWLAEQFKIAEWQFTPKNLIDPIKVQMDRQLAVKRQRAKKELGILTVVFGDSSIDSVRLSVECDVLDTKILPISQ